MHCSFVLPDMRRRQEGSEERVTLLRRGSRARRRDGWLQRPGGDRRDCGPSRCWAAGSVALTGFGIASVIEVTSGALLWWRLRAELGLAPLGPTVERRAARGAGFLLLALGVYIVTDSAWVLLTGSRPESSLIGIVLTAISLILMPLLALGN